MSLYRHILTGEVRDFDPAYITSHPKGASWGAYQPPPPGPPPIPQVISRRQLKEWLIRNDLYDTVVYIIAQIEDPLEERIALNWWTEAAEIERWHPMVLQITTTLGMNEEQVDDAFRAAGQL